MLYAIIIILLLCFICSKYYEKEKEKIRQEEINIEKSVKEIGKTFRDLWNEAKKIEEEFASYNDSEVKTIGYLIGQRTGYVPSNVGQINQSYEDLKKLIKLIEKLNDKYPELKKNKNISSFLQDKFEKTMNDLKEKVNQEYNPSVEAFNNKIKSFPISLIAQNDDIRNQSKIIL